MTPPPQKSLPALLATGALWLGLAPLIVGVVFEVTLVTASTDWEEKYIGSLHFLQDWGLGVVFLHLWFYLNAAGVLDGVVLSQAHAQPPRENVWQRRTLAVVNALHLGLSQGQWQAVTMNEFVREFAIP